MKKFLTNKKLDWLCKNKKGINPVLQQPP